MAETATGGLLANAFTDICGASKFFAGGCVCYSNDSKMQLLDVPECLLLQHGAVSAEAAVAMATGAAEKLGADYALAITGFAGPCGGPNENPVGTIYRGPPRAARRLVAQAQLSRARAPRSSGAR